MRRMIISSDGELLTGEFGLERETLRVTGDGYMAQTPHPFPEDPNIVRDFCENQTEINTGVHASAEAVIAELAGHSARLEAVLKERGEKLWLYSNPPYIRNAEDIPVARYEGAQRGKQSYRLYLAEKYGKYVMTLSGIHVNYSLSDRLLRQNYAGSGIEDYTAFKNLLYLHLARSFVRHGWIINLLMSASPICDGSYFSPEALGRPVTTRYASVRCGKDGYWNRFTPHLSYSSILAYAESIQKYVDNGELANAGELYYPVRLKPRGANRLNNLVQNGVNHIEIRNVDINPFAAYGIDARDLKFIELLLLFLVSGEDRPLTRDEQDTAAENFKNAALLDIDAARIHMPGGAVLSAREAGRNLLQKMRAFYSREGITAAPYEPGDILEDQEKKLTVPGRRYAELLTASEAETFCKGPY